MNGKKSYNNKQIEMFLDLELYIPAHHVARVIEAIPGKLLLAHYAHYTRGGRSSYHPKMMLKVILYEYLKKLPRCWRRS
ncbi:hypothetical protein BAG01nite_23070 [Brevibacillus agri]|uniref:Transposase n=1 Tax=Brevibacillus agri TaxID=51101 RepID=A0A3M8B7A9_9BACL|nr:transposase [Brevibacillus agri]QAV12286.1 hypothetical protein BA6348_05575 [Brevibacillus agri]RNB59318.1 transposase [Brevibacillus agri]GED26205.1 hypothetical protein BAG01nite_23070 [Brevibacillus agri]